MKATYRRPFAFVAMWLLAAVVGAANPDSSDTAVLTLKDGRQLSGRVEGDRLKFRSSIDTVPVSADKIVSLSEGALDLVGIGAIEGGFVGGDFVISTARGEVRQPAVDVIAIRRGPEAAAEQAAGDRQINVSTVIDLGRDGSGTSRQAIALPAQLASEIGPRLKEELKASSPAGAQVTEQTDLDSGQEILSVELAFEKVANLSDKSSVYHFEIQPAGFFQADYIFKVDFPKRLRWPLAMTVTLPGKIQESNGVPVGDNTINWRHDAVGKGTAGSWSARSSGLSIVGLLQGSGLWGQAWLSPERMALGGVVLTLLAGITGFTLRHRIHMPKLRKAKLRKVEKPQQAKRFCTKCGAELVQGKAFCTKCGEPARL